ncbi:MAG: phosphatase PAP2 family protein [Dehalococcoidia bacterium]
MTRTASIPLSALTRIAPSAAALTRDFAVVALIIAVYFLVRGAAPHRPEAAVELTLGLVRIETALGIFHEPWIQQVSIRSYATREFANAVYAYLHFPVMAAVGVWVWFRGRDRFVFMRNVMCVSMAIGLLFYYTLPAAPPRLMQMYGHDFGFVDTLFGGDTRVNYSQPSFILNEYAAVPSFHFGWIVLCSAMMWVTTSRRLVRALAVLLTALMTWSIIASANHFFLDMALGGLVIYVSWVAARRLAFAPRRAPTRALRAARPMPERQRV